MKELYQLELGKPLKLAHKLTERVLAPKSIEKCNVMLAERFFHESTIAALEHYSSGHPGWNQTAQFLRIIRTWWNVVNVRRPSIGYRKRNPMKMPINHPECLQITFLRDFEDWLTKWFTQEKGMKNRLKNCLTSETYMCAKQTTGALVELAAHLLRDHHLSYVLPGQVSSDSIEKRFGEYRQDQGGNYYISVRQILESEKSIRFKCLVKFAGITTADLKIIFKEDNEERAMKIEISVQLLLDSLPSDSIVIPDFVADGGLQGDESILFFVGGYCARSRANQTKCDACKDGFYGSIPTCQG